MAEGECRNILCKLPIEAPIPLYPLPPLLGFFSSRFSGSPILGLVVLMDMVGGLRRFVF